MRCGIFFFFLLFCFTAAIFCTIVSFVFGIGVADVVQLTSQNNSSYPTKNHLLSPHLAALLPYLSSFLTTTNRSFL